MSAKNYKAGDCVELVDGLEDSSYYGGIVFNDNMYTVSENSFFTIERANTNQYLASDANGFWWQLSDEMIKPSIKQYDGQSRNIINGICHLLGVEIGEEFEVLVSGKENWEIAQFTNIGFEFSNPSIAYTFVLTNLINGTFLYRTIKPILEPTEEECEIFEAAKKLGFKYVAKDRNGRCFYFIDKPYKDFDDGFWNTREDHALESNVDFKFLSWEDNESYEL